MKSFLGKKTLLSLMIMLAINAVNAQDVLRVDLNQALQIALTESPTVKVADMEIKKKEYVKKQTVAGLYPTISASGEYSRTIKKMAMSIGGNTIEVGTDNNWTAGFSLGVPVFAPSLYKASKINAIDIELAVESAQTSRQDLVNGVTKAYYQLLLAQDSYDVLQKSYTQAEENFVVVDNKYKQGTVSEYDKIRADVQVRNIKPSLVQAKNAVSLTKLQLKVLMGIDADVSLEIVGDLETYEDYMFSDFMKIDTTSMANNSTLKQLEIQERMLNENLKLDKTAFMPTLSLSAFYQWVAMNDDFKFKNYEWNPYSTVAITLSVPIFSGFKRTGKVKETKLQIQQLDWTKINTERSLRMQMKSYVDNMSTSLEQLDSNKEGVNQAEKGRMIAQKRYEVGAGTIIELNDSEVSLTQAKLAYNQAIFDFLISKADLDKVLGKDNYIGLENNK